MFLPLISGFVRNSAHFLALFWIFILRRKSPSLVYEFNSLPRKKEVVLANGQAVADEWHFDLRYVQLQPNPSHVVAFTLPGSTLFHVEYLPTGSANGMSFFPESSKEAAPEIVKAILHTFARDFGVHHTEASAPDVRSKMAPWRLTTGDANLAAAVGEELKGLGVNPVELCTVGISTKSVDKLMQDRFSNWFRGMKKAAGIPEKLFSLISTPKSIVFHREGRPYSASSLDENERDDEQNGKDYISQKRWPRHKVEGLDIDSSLRDIQSILKEKPTAIVQKAADAGDAEAAYDYGLRCLNGFDCPRDRRLARAYMFKALSSHRASDELKYAIHGTLIEWHISAEYLADPNRHLHIRYLFAAGHHANNALLLCRRQAFPATSPISNFMNLIFVPSMFEKPELLYLFQDVWDAWSKWKVELEAKRQNMGKKKSKTCRCSAPGCVPKTDLGGFLSKSEGKCEEKKCHHCGQESRKVDLEDPKSSTPSSDTKKVGRPSSGPSSAMDRKIQIPIALLNGTTILLTSNDNDPWAEEKILAYFRDDAN